MPRGDSFPHIPSLDGLRAVGVAFVMIAHSADPHLVGGFGVDIFFVLSGFLITSLLLVELERNGRLNLPAFYLRRAIRLYPALLTVLLLSLPIGVLAIGGRAVVDAVTAALYLTPVTTIVVWQPAYLGHLWTLALEEYFYLVWPILLIVLMKMRLMWKKQAALLVVTGVALYLASALLPSGAVALYARVGGIAIGCGLAYIWRYAPRKSRPFTSLAVALVMLAAAVALSADGSRWAYPVAALAAVAFIMSISDVRPTIAQRLLSTAPLVYIGRISYELYLWHEVVITLGVYLTGSPRQEIWWWAYAASIVLSAATEWAIRPLQLRSRAAVKRRFPDHVRASSAPVGGAAPA